MAARTTALGTADAAKWVNRQEHCLTQPRATISMSRKAGPCGRSVTHAAERRRGAPPQWNAKVRSGQAGLRSPWCRLGTGENQVNGSTRWINRVPNMHEFPTTLILFALVADAFGAASSHIVCCDSTSAYNVPFSADWSLVSAASTGSCCAPFTAEFGHPYRFSAAASPVTRTCRLDQEQQYARPSRDVCA